MVVNDLMTPEAGNNRQNQHWAAQDSRILGPGAGILPSHMLHSSFDAATAETVTFVQACCQNRQ